MTRIIERRNNKVSFYIKFDKTLKKEKNFVKEKEKLAVGY